MVGKFSVLIISVLLVIGCKNNEGSFSTKSDSGSKHQNTRKHTPEEIEGNRKILKEEAVRVVKNSNFEFQKRKILGYTLFKLDEEGITFKETVNSLENIPVGQRNVSDKKTLGYLKGLLNGKK